MEKRIPGKWITLLGIVHRRDRRGRREITGQEKNSPQVAPVK